MGIILAKMRTTSRRRRGGIREVKQVDLWTFTWVVEGPKSGGCMAWPSVVQLHGSRYIDDIPILWGLKCKV